MLVDLTRMTPADQLSGMVGGDLLSQAIGVVAGLGLPDQLAVGHRSSDDLAAAVGADPHALARILRCLAVHQFVDDRGDGRYALNPMSSLLCRDHPGSLAEWVLLRTALSGPLSEAMLHATRTGECAFEYVHKASFYEYLAGHPDLEVPWNASMRPRARQLASSLLELVDWRGVGTVVDVGGSTGALLTTLLRGIHASGTVFDQPHVAAAAQRELELADLDHRVTATGGDFLVDVPPGADRYVLANVVCDWPDEQAVTILSRCREAMAEASRIVICEQVLPDGPGSPSVALTDLAQFTLLGGELRGRTAWNSLLHASGLRLTNLRAGLECSVLEVGIR